MIKDNDKVTIISRKPLREVQKENEIEKAKTFQECILEISKILLGYVDLNFLI